MSSPPASDIRVIPLVQSRWEPKSPGWVQDDFTGPCTGAGDPYSVWTAELYPHGKHTNIGAYGGTTGSMLRRVLEISPI